MRDEMMIIASNRPSEHPKDAINIYRLRWGIEVLFFNTKSGGFNFEDTHMTDPKKIAKLFAII
jgi:hypothetical protein